MNDTKACADYLGVHSCCRTDESHATAVTTAAPVECEMREPAHAHTRVSLNTEYTLASWECFLPMLVFKVASCI